MQPQPDLAAALAGAARSLNQQNALDDTLSAIAHTALRSVPGFDYLGISTVDRKGNGVSKAATGDLVWDLDKLQYHLGEGPCVETLRDADVVVAPHVRHDQRWPRYVPQAVRLGLRSQLAVKLYLDQEGPLGGLNLYPTAREDIDPDAEPLGQVGPGSHRAEQSTPVAFFLQHYCRPEKESTMSTDTDQTRRRRTPDAAEDASNPRPAGPTIVASVVAGAVTALVLALVVFAGGDEPTITGLCCSGSGAA